MSSTGSNPPNVVDPKQHTDGTMPPSQPKGVDVDANADTKAPKSTKK